MSRIHLFWETIAFTVVFSHLALTAGDLEPIFEQCCNIGIGWARTHTTCTGFPIPVLGIPPNQQVPCISAVEVCCIRSHRKQKCEAGKETAKLNQECSVLPSVGGEAHKDCCEGCKLGLIVANQQKPCTLKSFSFGSPWDETFYECCTESIKDKTEVSLNQQDISPLSESRNRCETNNPCSHRCIDTGIAIQCDCYSGYKLAADQHNCEDINECEQKTHTCNSLNEVCTNTVGGFQCVDRSSPPIPHLPRTRRCPLGYSLNPIKETCDDIDECSLSIHNCNKKTEECSNTIGSFSCSIRLNSQCPPGFKYHDETDRCIDVDECAEGLDDCNRDQEFCLNSFGGYNCEARTSRECPAGYKWNKSRSSCEDIDECSEGSHSCNLTIHICLNTVGTFRCISKSPDCSTGYRKNSLSGRCDDIDECSEGSHNCNLQAQTCVNVVSTFRCISKTPECPHGYKKNLATNRCEDVNECTEGTHDCDVKTQYCVNTLASYQCQTRTPPQIQKCGSGYAFDFLSGICRDINECLDSNPCQAEQTCENTLGSYKCICRPGFIIDPSRQICKDINECSLGIHNCADSQRCDNTIGSYTCIRFTGCGTGYTLNAALSECEDDDECILGNHNCGPGFTCRNTLGSFRCDRVRCPSGQRLLPDGSCQTVVCSTGMQPDSTGNCVDTNECINRSICLPNQRCINTVGSFLCQNLLTCTGGYEINEYGNQCTDIDECARRIHECKTDQICRNRPGGYLCECPTGYSVNDQRDCEDVNECERFKNQICSVNSECQNTQGSYVCNCKTGFKRAEDERNCIDIDECIESPNICQQKCINIWGSYQCSCNQGFTLSPDGRSCQDIDECALWEGKGNLCIGFCVNDPGSYSCSCPEGYRLSADERTCQDINECQEQDVCKSENEVCLNTRGGYKCNIINCPPNYVRDLEHRNRCKRSNLECSPRDSECLKEPLSFSYNYITFVSNMRIPPTGQLDLFTMRGPRFTITTVQFDLSLKDSRAPEGIVAANRDYFHLRRTAFNEAMVSLVKPILGPQEIELELTMKMYHDGLFGGSAVARIFIFVTRHEF